MSEEGVGPTLASLQATMDQNQASMNQKLDQMMAMLAVTSGHPGDEGRARERLMICDRAARVGDVVFCKTPFRYDSGLFGFVGMVERIGWGNSEGKLMDFPMSFVQSRPCQEVVERRLCTRHTPIIPFQRRRGHYGTLMYE